MSWVQYPGPSQRRLLRPRVGRREPARAPARPGTRPGSADGLLGDPAGVQPAVDAALADQAAVRAALHDASLVDDHDLVGVLGGGHAVRDGDRRAAALEAF